MIMKIVKYFNLPPNESDNQILSMIEMITVTAAEQLIHSINTSLSPDDLKHTKTWLSAYMLYVTVLVWKY